MNNSISMIIIKLHLLSKVLLWTIENIFHGFFSCLCLYCLVIISEQSSLVINRAVKFSSEKCSLNIILYISTPFNFSTFK